MNKKREAMNDTQNVLVSPDNRSTVHHSRLQDAQKMLAYWCHVLTIYQAPFPTDLDTSQPYHTANIPHLQYMDRNQKALRYKCISCVICKNRLL